jgi:anti-anti-sigma factor
MPELFTISQDRSVFVVELLFPPDTDAMAYDTVIAAITVEMDRSGGKTFNAWVVDLSRINYLNSAGLGLLVNIRQKVRSNKGKLAICGLSPRLVELFKSCCLERLFVIVKTRGQAVGEVGG